MMPALPSALPYFSAAAAFTLLARWRAKSLGNIFRVRHACMWSLIGYCAMAFIDAPLTFRVEILVACLAVSIASDIDAGFIYDVVTLPAFGLILVLDACAGHFFDGMTGAGCAAIVSGALHTATGRRGIGLGDVKLFGVAGAVLSAFSSLAVIGAAFVAGAAVISAALAVGRVRWRDRIPFAPYIGVASVGVIALGGLRW